MNGFGQEAGWKSRDPENRLCFHTRPGTSSQLNVPESQPQSSSVQHIPGLIQLIAGVLSEQASISQIFGYPKLAYVLYCLLPLIIEYISKPSIIQNKSKLPLLCGKHLTEVLILLPRLLQSLSRLTTCPFKILKCWFLLCKLDTSP